MTDLLQVFLLSMTPFGELRLSIPIGIALFNLNVFSVFLVSVIGNLIPATFLLLFLERISNYLSQKSATIHKILTWWSEKTKSKHYEKVQKYGVVGLALFVGIPVPFTGAWTGALLATIMNLPLKKSLLAILAGVIGAGLIVTTAVVTGIRIEKYLGWQALVGLLLVLIFIFIFRKFLTKK
ncbi:MAG: small multi-drug export protein [Candidatus Staskawiczbacteria bacterium]|jgi:uncharacterized membrane protein